MLGWLATAASPTGRERYSREPATENRKQGEDRQYPSWEKKNPITVPRPTQVVCQNMYITQIELNV